jgi:hypothetical protein
LFKVLNCEPVNIHPPFFIWGCEPALAELMFFLFFLFYCSSLYVHVDADPVFSGSVMGIGIADEQSRI